MAQRQKPPRGQGPPVVLFRAPKDLREQLDALVARDGEALSVVVRRLLRRGLERS